MKPFAIIVACDQNNGIGFKGKLPWHLPSDLKYFKEITTRVSSPGKMNAVIMGRVTWESIPLKYRPLPQRINVILSRNQTYEKPEGVLLAGSLTQALEVFSDAPYKNIESIFVIGGQQVFREAIVHPFCQRIFITKLLHSFNCDTFFPPIPSAFNELHRTKSVLENNIEFFFCECFKNAN